MWTKCTAARRNRAVDVDQCVSNVSECGADVDLMWVPELPVPVRVPILEEQEIGWVVRIRILKVPTEPLLAVGALSADHVPARALEQVAADHEIPQAFEIRHHPHSLRDLSL